MGRFRLLLFLLLSFKTYSYTNFIGYGYTSCSTCHYNPFGGGPLNDYGRGVAANYISGKVFYPHLSDEKVSQYSGFLGAFQMPKWIRPSIDYRGLKLNRNYGEESEQKEYINMSMEYNLVLKYGKNDKYFYSFSLAQYPNEEGQFSGSENRDEYISRENYLGYKYNNQINILAGVFDTVFGLKIPNHTAFSKTITGTGQSDQTIGTALYYNNQKIEGGVHLFIGNPNENDNTKQQGLSGTIEFELGNSKRIGGSLLYSKSEFLDKKIIAGLFRIPFGKGSSIIGELGYSIKSPLLTSDNSETNQYSFIQSQLKIMRGLHLMTTFQTNFYTIDNVDTNSYIFGPGIHWFPIQRVELRSEFYNSRSFSNEKVTEDNWMWLTNIHLYL